MILAYPKKWSLSRMLPEISALLNRDEPVCINYTSKRQAGVQPKLTFLFIGTLNNQYLP